MILRPPVLRAIGAAYTSCRSFQNTARAFGETLRDEDIKARYVRLVDPETGSLQDAQKIQTLLRKMDRMKYWLVQVKAGKLDQEESEEEAEISASSSLVGKNKGCSKQSSPWMQPSLDGRKKQEIRREELESEMSLEDLAIVKMINKKEFYNLKKEKRKERRDFLNGASPHRNSVAGLALAAQMDIHMTWSSTDHDIDHKLKILLNHLKKRGPGSRGTVTIKAKPGKGRNGGMEIEDKRILVQKIEDRLCIWEKGEAELPSYHARRNGDVDWKGGESQAIVRFEVVKGAPKPTQ